MNIISIADNLELMEGIWYSKTKSSVSYPEDGNENCLQIEKDSFWFMHRNRCIVNLVSKLSPEDILLDIGGGNGYVSLGLQEKGIRTILLEPGEKGTANAKSRGVSNIICSTLENAGLKNGSIDSAGLFDVLEHIENDQEFLNRIYQQLKPGGLIYMTVPSFNFLWSDADTHAGHYRRYTLGGLNRLLERSGFDIVYSTYFFSLLPLPLFLFRSIPSKLGLGKDPNSLKKRKSEHDQRSFIKNQMNRVWEWELNKINKQGKINFGSSCLVAARKKN
jgi:SAM-dependent methyltransferase